MPSPIGLKISRYRILEELGRGGMGVVYRAEEMPGRRSVVVKVLSPEAAGDSERRERFQREARACSAISHPGITAIYETGEEDGLPFICMEHVEGETLRSLLRLGALAIDRAVDLIAQVADAVASAHALGITHRDLKPENIMVTPDGRAKVLDFGIAAISDVPPDSQGEVGAMPTNVQRLTTMGALLGTVSYMSPEQAAGRPAGPASDVFSLGAVLYESIAGSRPFRGENDMAILHAITYDNPAPLSARRAETHASIDAVVKRALRKNPADRYPGAAPLRDDLLRALGEIRAGGTATAIPLEETGKIPAAARSRGSSRAGALAPGAKGARGARGESPLVGRADQMRQLDMALQAALEGKGQVVLISGEAGIGKTRLVAECGARFESRGANYVVGRCLFREGGIPYHPFVEAAERLTSLLGVETADDLRAYVAERVPALAGRLPILLSFLHLPGSSPAGAAEAVNKEHLLDAIAAFFVQAAQIRPLVLHIDDLHWADEGSLDLFQYLARGFRRSCGLLAGTYRPEEARALLSRFSTGDPYIHISLDRFGPAETEKILAASLPGARLERRFVDGIHRDTAGNPFFVLEALRLLEADGLIRKENGEYTVQPEAEGAPLPARVHEVVTRRLTRLSSTERQLMEVAACEGMTFRSSTLAACLARERYEVLASLQSLEREHRLIRHEDESYRFDHPMIREALYEEVIPELRREYHRRIAAHLVAPDAGEAHRPEAAAVAFHLLEAREDERAIPSLLEAAEQARALFANADARATLDRAVSILDALDATPGGQRSPSVANWRIKAHKDRGKILVRLGEIEKARADFQEMRSRARGASLASKEAHAENLLADLGVRTGDYTTAMEHARRAHDLAQTIGDRHSLATAFAVMGVVHFNHGSFDQSLAAHSRSITLQQSIDDLPGYADNLNKIGNIHLRQGHTEEALAVYGTALGLARQVRHRLFEAEAVNNIGAVHHERGELDEALKNYEEALSLKREIGDRRATARSLNNLGLLREIRGEFTAAMAAHQESLALKRELGDQAGISSSLSNLGSLFEKMGEYGRALDCCEESLAIKRALGETWSIPYCQNALGRVRLALNDVDRAEELFSDALRQTREQGDRPEECRSIMNLAEALLVSGNREGAVSILKDAAGLARDLRLKESLVEIHYLSGLALLELGEIDEAAAQLLALKQTRAGTHFAQGEIFGRHLEALVLRSQEGAPAAREAFSSAIAAARDVGLRGLEWRILDDAGQQNDARESLLTLAEGIPAGETRLRFLGSSRARGVVGAGPD